jgi:hypothetical protein
MWPDTVLAKNGGRGLVSNRFGIIEKISLGGQSRSLSIDNNAEAKVGALLVSTGRAL